MATGMNFPAPSWIADYEYVNTVIHGKTMVEVQYSHGEKTADFLISQGGENGIGTTDPVKTEVIEGAKVYFANGIVIWEHEGFTVELYTRDDFDTATLGKIIKGFAVGAPPTQEEIDMAKSKGDSMTQTEKATLPLPQRLRINRSLMSASSPQTVFKLLCYGRTRFSTFLENRVFIF